MSTPNNSVLQNTINEVTLPARQIWREGGEHCGQVVTCVRGIVWLTHEGMPGDYLLTPGQEFIVERRGLLLAQGLRDAVLQITDPASPDLSSKASLN